MIFIDKRMSYGMNKLCKNNKLLKGKNAFFRLRATGAITSTLRITIMNNYEAKQKARRERYEKKAEQLRAEAERLHEYAHQMADVIPFGQPILVGHHSETVSRKCANSRPPSRKQRTSESLRGQPQARRTNGYIAHLEKSTKTTVFSNTGDHAMTLIDCLNDLMAHDNSDHIRLDDGATTWDLDYLYYAVINSPDYDEGIAYSVQDDGIYAVDADGYLVSPPAYRLHIVDTKPESGYL